MLISTGMFRTAGLVTAIACAGMVSPTISLATVTTASLCTYVSRPNCSFFLEGRISPDDVSIFKRSLEKAGSNGSLLLFLNSEGGDLSTAIEIGKLVRRWPNSSVQVLQDSRCFSACVFVLAGGLHRQVDGQVGIHRPFNSTTDSNTYESTQKTFRMLEQSAKAFLKDMNVPTSLYDEMMSVPPQKLRLLTDAELARFGIGQSDPAWQDNQDAMAAQGYGYNKEEYLRRKERAHRICEALYVNKDKSGIELTVGEAGDIQDACKEAVLTNKTGRLLENGKVEVEESQRFTKQLEDRLKSKRPSREN